MNENVEIDLDNFADTFFHTYAFINLSLSLLQLV